MPQRKQQEIMSQSSFFPFRKSFNLQSQPFYMNFSFYLFFFLGQSSSLKDLITF